MSWLSVFESVARQSRLIELNPGLPRRFASRKDTILAYTIYGLSGGEHKQKMGFRSAETHLLLFYIFMLVPGFKRIITLP